MATITTAQQLKQTIEQMQGRPCFLCGQAPARNAGIYEPDNPLDKALFGKPERGQRCFFYAICGDCIGFPDVLERIEKKMRAELVMRQ